MSRLSDYLAGSGATRDGPGLAIYHGPVNEDDDGPVEVCLPFKGSVEPAGDMAIRLEPAHREAYTTLSKEQFEYPAILQAYHAVEAWISERGGRPMSSPREVYFGDWGAVKDDEPVADVAWPYAG